MSLVGRGRGASALADGRDDFRHPVRRRGAELREQLRNLAAGRCRMSAATKGLRHSRKIDLAVGRATIADGAALQIEKHKYRIRELSPPTIGNLARISFTHGGDHLDARGEVSNRSRNPSDLQARAELFLHFFMRRTKPRGVRHRRVDLQELVERLRAVHRTQGERKLPRAGNAMQPAIVVVGHVDDSFELLELHAATALAGQPLTEIIENETRRRAAVVHDSVGEGNVDLALLQAVDRRAVMIDPVNAEPALGKTAEVSVGLGRGPGDVGDPEFLIAEGIFDSETADYFIDPRVSRKPGADLDAGIVPRDGNGSRDSVEAVRSVAYDVNEAGAIVFSHRRPSCYTLCPMRTRANGLLGVVIAVCVFTARDAEAGWILERLTHTEGGSGQSSRVTLLVAKGRVKEVHDDGTYFLWDVPRGTLFQVDPRAKSYSGGPVKDMIAQVKKYLDEMRERIAQMTDEQREELARHTEGLPVPVPPPATPPRWTVKATSRTLIIAGHKARLYEIARDGSLFEERWLAPSVDFGEDLDYARYARWSQELEASFAVGMGGSVPSGEEVEALYRQGVEVKSVLVGEKIRVVSEVTRLEKQEIPESTFTLPPDYLLKGERLSRYFSGSLISACLPTTTRIAFSG